MTVAGSRRPRRRGSARDTGAAGGIQQAPWGRLENTRPFMEILSADELESIHEASMTVLEEIGIEFLLPEARELLKRAGADVDEGGMRVRFDRAMIAELLAMAPSEFTPACQESGTKISGSAAGT